MERFTRQYFYEVSNDKQTIVIGTHWNPETNKLNQLGSISKNDFCSAFVDFEFKFPDGRNINLKRVLISEALGNVIEYFSKGDLIALSELLYLWG